MDQQRDPVDPATERFPRINPAPPQYAPPPQPWPQQHRAPAPAPVEKKRTGRKVLAWSAVALFALFVIAGVSGNRGSSPGPAASGGAVPVVEGAAPAAVPGDDGTIGDGTHIVGVDIEPGTYRSSGAEAGLFELCAWFTKDGPSSNSGIIDFGTGNVDEAQVVEIGSGVKAFESQGCEAWTRVS
ncbi:MAG: hypothetical protein L0I24_08120 [Pseudonocardia sp.]|nr:hypothetical protein [Pseudonocardia sp.]